MYTSEKIKKLAVETLALNEEVFAPDTALESLGPERGGALKEMREENRACHLFPIDIYYFSV